MYRDYNERMTKMYYRLKQINFDGTYEYSNIIEVNLLKNIKYELSQNYPNPFNPNTYIDYSIPEKCFITLKVFDLLGKEIVTLVNQEQAPGDYQVAFSGQHLSTGLYFYTLQTENFISTKKLILLK